jgi:hypothetical protein
MPTLVVGAALLFASSRTGVPIAPTVTEQGVPADRRSR